MKDDRISSPTVQAATGINREDYLLPRITQTIDLGGTWRDQRPEETLRRLEAPEVLEAIGVTRIAYIDGLDRIGIPTVVAHRPRGRALSSHQGKGVDHDLATISALMEALECDRAERFEAVDHVGSLRDLRDHDVPVVTPADIPGSRLLVRPEADEAAAERDWLRFEPLGGGDAHLVPASLVRMDLDTDHERRREEACWMPPNTNGIAAGNTAEEAVLHAMCEVVERHALAKPAVIIPVDPGAISDPWIAMLTQRLESVGIEARLRIRFGRVAEGRGVVRIPTYTCVLLDRDSGFARRPEAFGSGSHPSPRIAVLRAMTEAVQARTSLIAGARDDLLPEAYALASPFSPDRQHAEHVAADGPDPFAITPTDHERLIDSCQRRLAEAGFDRVLVRSIEMTQTDAASFVPVRRVVIPGMRFDPGPQRWRASLR